MKGNMETKPDTLPLFRKTSAIALFKGWVALLASFILCLGAQIPVLSKIQTPENPLIASYMVSGIGIGAAICAFAVLLTLPALARLSGTPRNFMHHYVITPTLWTGLMGMALGAVAAFLGLQTGQAPVPAFFATYIVCFITLIVPVLMTSVSYWFLLIRPAAGHEGGAQAVTLYSSLLILWNVYCYVIASALIHLPSA
jgi:hypothetical protein